MDGALGPVTRKFILAHLGSFQNEYCILYCKDSGNASLIDFPPKLSNSFWGSGKDDRPEAITGCLLAAVCEDGGGLVGMSFSAGETQTAVQYQQIILLLGFYGPRATLFQASWTAAWEVWILADISTCVTATDQNLSCLWTADVAF